MSAETWEEWPRTSANAPRGRLGFRPRLSPWTVAAACEDEGGGWPGCPYPPEARCTAARRSAQPGPVLPRPEPLPANPPVAPSRDRFHWVGWAFLGNPQPCWASLGTRFALPGMWRQSPSLRVTHN